MRRNLWQEAVTEAQCRPGKAIRVGNKSAKVVWSYGYTFAVSYDTVIAASYKDEVFVAGKKFSVTTSRHQREFVGVMAHNAVECHVCNIKDLMLRSGISALLVSTLS
jgi:hypothetical protein